MLPLNQSKAETLLCKPHPPQEIFAFDKLMKDRHKNVLTDKQQQDQGKRAVPGTRRIDEKVGWELPVRLGNIKTKQVGGQGNGDA